MIVPKRHVADYFALSHHEKTACSLMADRVQGLLQQRFQPAGYQLSTELTNPKQQHSLHAYSELKLYQCQLEGSA